MYALTLDTPHKNPFELITELESEVTMLQEEHNRLSDTIAHYERKIVHEVRTGPTEQRLIDLLAYLSVQFEQQAALLVHFEKKLDEWRGIAERRAAMIDGWIAEREAGRAVQG